jgi:hypothetical protein
MGKVAGKTHKRGVHASTHRISPLFPYYVFLFTFNPWTVYIRSVIKILIWTLSTGVRYNFPIYFTNIKHCILGIRQLAVQVHIAGIKYIHIYIYYLHYTLCAQSMISRNSRLWAPNLSSMRYGKGGTRKALEWVSQMFHALPLEQTRNCFTHSVDNHTTV